MTRQIQKFVGTRFKDVTPLSICRRVKLLGENVIAKKSMDVNMTDSHTRQILIKRLKLRSDNLRRVISKQTGPFSLRPGESLTVIRDPDSATAENIRHLSDKRYVATHATGCLQCGYYKRLQRKTISVYARKSKEKHVGHFFRIPVKADDMNKIS